MVFTEFVRTSDRGHTRRRVLRMAAAGAGGAALAGCGPFGHAAAPPPAADPLEPLLAEAVALAAAYDRVAAAQPGLAARLTPLADDHRAHATALADLIGRPVPSASPPSQPQLSEPPQSQPVPSQPVPSQPAQPQPVPSQPAQPQPVPSQPAQPQPAQPQAPTSQGQLSQAQVSQAQASQAQASQAELSQLAPSESAPSQLAASGSAVSQLPPSAAGVRESLIALRAAEQTGQRNAVNACRQAPSGQAALIGSIAACRATHVEALR